MKKIVFLFFLLYAGLVSAQEVPNIDLTGRTYCLASYAMAHGSSNVGGPRFSSVASKYGSSGYLLFISPTEGILIYTEGYYNGHEGNYEVVLTFTYTFNENNIILTATTHSTKDSHWKEFKTGTFPGYFLDNSIYIDFESTHMLFISIDN